MYGTDSYNLMFTEYTHPVAQHNLIAHVDEEGRRHMLDASKTHSSTGLVGSLVLATHDLGY